MSSEPGGAVGGISSGRPARAGRAARVLNRGRADMTLPRWVGRGWTILDGADPRPKVMGIVNATPDSFSDGGRTAGRDEAAGHALRLVEEGADLLDLGGESSRPGAEPVSVDEESHRVLPV